MRDNDGIKYEMDLGKAEKNLIKAIYEFQEVVQTAGSSMSPALIANYAFDLAKDFNRFYLNNRILNEPTGVKEARANLVYAVKTVLVEGLRLLGIDAPEKM